jgi:beta-lactamase superfamily II metal-dependent hydrolase
LTLLTCALLGGAAHAAEPTLKMVPLDLEGDGGTLYVTPEGQSLLIDAGSPAELSGGVKNGLDGAKDGVDRIIATAQSLGVKKIDYLLITHYHADHVGGVAELLARFPVGTIIDHGPNRQIVPDATGHNAGKVQSTVIYYAKYLEAIKGHEHVVAKAGDVFHFGSLTDTIVIADGKPIADPLPGAGEPGTLCDTGPMAADGGIENAMSVGSLLSFGKVKIAAFGDLTWDREHDLVCPVNKIGHVAILLLDNHGIDVSNNPAFVAALKPDLALMGNGPTHGGMPASVKTVAASPGLQGFWKLHASMVNPNLDGDPNYIANLGASPSHGYALMLDIARDGRVTVTNPRNGFSQTYQVR